MQLHGVIIANSQRNSDELVAEIWVENEQIAEVYFEGEQVLIEFFLRLSNKEKRLSYHEYLSMIDKVNEFVSSYMTEAEYKKLQ